MAGAAAAEAATFLELWRTTVVRRTFVPIYAFLPNEQRIFFQQGKVIHCIDSGTEACAL